MATEEEKKKRLSNAARSSQNFARQESSRKAEAAGVFSTGGTFGIQGKNYSNTPAGRKKEANAQFAQALSNVPKLIEAKQKHELNMALATQKAANAGSLASVTAQGKYDLKKKKMELDANESDALRELKMIDAYEANRNKAPTDTGVAQPVATSNVRQLTGGIGGTDIRKTGSSTYTNILNGIGDSVDETAALDSFYTTPDSVSEPGKKKKLNPYEKFVVNPVSRIYAADKKILSKVKPAYDYTRQLGKDVGKYLFPSESDLFESELAKDLNKLIK